MSERIVLAYSGDVESSAAIAWLVGQRQWQVVALVLDLGQRRPLEELRVRALALGAARAHVLDVRDDFARECILPALRSGSAQPQAGGKTLAYPLIARKLAEVALIEQATAVAHGGSAAAHQAITAAVRQVNPRLAVLEAAREARLDAAALAVFAKAHGVPAAGGFKVDCSLWGRTVIRPQAEGDAPMPDSVYALTRSVGRTPDLAAHIELEFEDGLPVSVNGVPMPLVELIESVTTIAGNHGVGRAELSGATGVCEAPAAVVLAEAHDALAPGGHTLASGVVRMKLFRGEHVIVGHSPVPVSPTPALVDVHS